MLVDQHPGYHCGIGFPTLKGVWQLSRLNAHSLEWMGNDVARSGVSLALAHQGASRWLNNFIRQRSWLPPVVQPLVYYWRNTHITRSRAVCADDVVESNHGAAHMWFMWPEGADVEFLKWTNPWRGTEAIPDGFSEPIGSGAVCAVPLAGSSAPVPFRCHGDCDRDTSIRYLPAKNEARKNEGPGSRLKASTKAYHKLAYHVAVSGLGKVSANNFAPAKEAFWLLGSGACQSTPLSVSIRRLSEGSRGSEGGDVFDWGLKMKDLGKLNRSNAGRKGVSKDMRTHWEA
ncbi:hypothetical protein BDN72DRAFT_865947 [Pluteus cervinus]|uniref:Uncharacterized protein n=1 Tax=Pluteus cervinus TaxID=181527 RepID=A0ACD2ZZ72_9AGAR|nr:hypothetical protein BDN72DRAFT_865947 [Pluteus cervinus]